MSLTREWSSLSSSKQKLFALLDKLDTCIKAAPDDSCDTAFGVLSEFTLECEKEQSRRSKRPRSPLLPSFVGTTRIRERPKNSHLRCCDLCAAPYCNEQLCDECKKPLRWCFTGYSRTPLQDPMYPSVGGHTSICGECLKKKSESPSRIIQQEEECLRIVAVFSDPLAKWKWVSCLCEGASLISLTWSSLEGLLFSLFPFYCRNGTANHIKVETRQDPRFHEFVVGVAKDALFILAEETRESMRVQAWRSVAENPELPAHFVDADFELVWKAVAQRLSKTFPTQICIWGRKNHGFECLEKHGPPTIDCREVNIFKWNLGVAHFDLIVPVLAADLFLTSDELFLPTESFPMDILDAIGGETGHQSFWNEDSL